MTPTNVTFVRAVVRLIFGLIQVTGATAALIFLLQSGASIFTITSVTITGLITIASRLLFRRERAAEALDRRRHDS